MTGNLNVLGVTNLSSKLNVDGHTNLRNGLAVEGNINLSNNLSIGGSTFLDSKETDVGNSSAISLNTTSSLFQTSGAETSTLATGTEGQIKVLAMHTDGGDMVVTVTNAGWKSSGTGTITFDTIGDACTLQYINSKWFAIGNNGAAFA